MSSGGTIKGLGRVWEWAGRGQSLVNIKVDKITSVYHDKISALSRDQQNHRRSRAGEGKSRSIADCLGGKIGLVKVIILRRGVWTQGVLEKRWKGIGGFQKRMGGTFHSSEKKIHEKSQFLSKTQRESPDYQSLNLQKRLALLQSNKRTKRYSRSNPTHLILRGKAAVRGPVLELFRMIRNKSKPDSGQWGSTQGKEPFSKNQK